MYQSVRHLAIKSHQTAMPKIWALTWLLLSAIWQALGIIAAEPSVTWWRHQMELFSALLAICVGNSPVTGEFPTKRPVTRSFDVFFDLRLNKRLNKHSVGWWFETPSCSLWRHCNAIIAHIAQLRNFARIKKFGDKMSNDLASRVSGTNMIRCVITKPYVCSIAYQSSANKTWYWPQDENMNCDKNTICHK